MRHAGNDLTGLVFAIPLLLMFAWKAFKYGHDIIGCLAVSALVISFYLFARLIVRKGM